MDKYELKMIWGETQETKKTYHFDTKSEVDAFLLGVAEMDGWLGYEIGSLTNDK